MKNFFKVLTNSHCIVAQLAFLLALRDRESGKSGYMWFGITCMYLLIACLRVYMPLSQKKLGSTSGPKEEDE